MKCRDANNIERHRYVTKIQKRLAIFLPSLNGGGAEHAMLNLAHGLSERGLSVDLVLAQAKGPYLANVRKSLRLVDLKASRVLLSLPELVRYLRRERPEALLSALDYANITALWARRLAGLPIKAVVNEQNTISRSANNSARRRQKIVPYLAKRFYPWSDGIVAVSEGVAGDLSQVLGVPREEIRVIFNPVVTPELHQKAQGPLNHPWFKVGQPPVVLAIGRLTVQKDFPTLIQAFARVRQRQSARLVILGEGPDRPILETLVNELDIDEEVALPGFVENPYAYLGRASLYVLSSRWEGLPTVLIEALCCGVPIISTDCPSGPREILADGHYGSLVPVENVAALAEAIESGLAGDTPRPTVESWRPYTQKTVVDQYINLFEI